LDKDTIVIRMEKQEAAFWPRIRDWWDGTMQPVGSDDVFCSTLVC
jgi:hypothetical protein